jgi:hypothetical protein
VITVLTIKFIINYDIFLYKMAKYKSALQTKWNAESEKMVKQIGERAEGYIWMCDMDATYYSRLSISFTIVSGLLALICGTAQITISNIRSDNSNSTNDINDSYPETILGVANYVVAGLIGLMKLNNFDAFVDRLKRSSGKFRDLQSDVQQQLSMQRVDRMPAINYIKAISGQYNKITSNKTFKIRRATVEKLKKQFADSGVTLPEIAGGIEQINVAVPEPALSVDKMEAEQQEEESDVENQLNQTDDDSGDDTSSSVTSTGDIDASAPVIPAPAEDSSPPIIAGVPGTSAELDPSQHGKHVNISTDTESPPNKNRKQTLARKKSTKSPKKSTTTAYMGLQHHNHIPNMQEINFQLSRFGGT